MIEKEETEKPNKLLELTLPKTETGQGHELVPLVPVRHSFGGRGLGI